MNWKEVLAADVVIVINSWKAAVACRSANPDARIFLWVHNVPGRHNRKMGRALKQADVTIVCVSGTHARNLARFLGDEAPEIRHIYNPVPDDLLPSGVPHDPDLLIFASAPHKGLREVYQTFSVLRKSLPSLRLAVANPGYMAWDAGPVPEGVEVLGRKPKARLWHSMEQALCLFYPQTSFAETFGIVLAEANAVGCPVLVHKGLGANDEVPSSSEQVVDCANHDLILQKLLEWRERRPTVSVRPEFRLSAVVDKWRGCLGLSDHHASGTAHRVVAAE
jgi:glycosyltransferase involved in cell wall biosynthesis